MDTRSREDLRGEGMGDLAPLRKLTDWQVQEGDPDIRGWDVIDTNGDKVGQVNDLVINRRTGEAEFSDVEYGGSLGIGTKHTLIPIDELSLDRDNRRVLTRFLGDALKSAPEYKEDMTDFGAFGGFWSGVAAAASRGGQAIEGEGRREGMVQKFVQRMEPGRRPEQEREEEHLRKVRVHMAHRTASGDETTLKEGDVLEIPVAGEQLTGRTSTIVEEIVIRLEAVEEEEEEREPAHHFRV